MAKTAFPDDEPAVWGEDDDVYVPQERVKSLLSLASLPTRGPASGGGHVAGAAASRTGSRRVSSMLGSLHPHAGHSSWPTATGHLITAIIGAGVLGLPNAVAWLGWAGGLVSLCAFYVITAITCTMLTDCYHVKGKRHTRYKWAVLHIMGPRHSIILAICQNLNMALTTIGYQIAAADSMRYIARLSCQMQGKGADCPLQSQWSHTLVFGAVQVLMSMLPNLESAWWASAIGAAMSIGYSTIAVGLGASQAGNHLGSLLGRPGHGPVEKAFGVLNSLGSIGFAYSSAIVLLEVQDTLREPPKAAVSMKKAVNAGLGTTFFFYLLVTVLCYMALGDVVPDNVLLGFANSPAWVNMLANAMVLVHMVSAFQVYAQPVYQTIEDVFIGCAPTLQFASPKKEFAIRMAYRTVYVILTTFIACALPFFGAFTGLVGAVTFFPTAVAYPILMYTRVMPTTRPQRAALWVIFCAMGLVAVGATAGSLESIVHMAGEFKMFSSRRRL